MKKTIATLAALMLCAACSHSKERAQTVREESTTRTLSGSTTAAPAVPRGNTINDHYKLYEMCQSLNIDQNCEDVAMRCHGEADAEACMKNLNH